jgi:hypothetical protein
LAPWPSQDADQDANGDLACCCDQKEGSSLSGYSSKFSWFIELELELTQTQKTQKPMVRVEMVRGACGNLTNKFNFISRKVNISHLFFVLSSIVLALPRSDSAHPHRADVSATKTRRAMRLFVRHVDKPWGNSRTRALGLM